MVKVMFVVVVVVMGWKVGEATKPNLTEHLLRVHRAAAQGDQENADECRYKSFEGRKGVAVRVRVG